MATNFDIPQFGTGASPGINASRMQAIWTFLKALASGGSGSVVNADAVGGVALSGLAQQASGTWTPRLLFGGNDVGRHYTIQQGAYTIIGNRCFFNLYIGYDVKGSSTGNVTLTLPLATFSSASYASFSIGYNMGIAYNGQLSAYLEGAPNGFISLTFTSEAGALIAMADYNLEPIASIMISGHYPIA